MTASRRFLIRRPGRPELVVYAASAAAAEALVHGKGFATIGDPVEAPLVAPDEAHVEQNPTTGVRKRPIPGP